MPRNVEQHECPVRYSILMLNASMIPVMDVISYSKKKTKHTQWNLWYMRINLGWFQIGGQWCLWSVDKNLSKVKSTVLVARS